MSCVSFYLFSFFIYKIREQEGRTGRALGGGMAAVGREEVLGKGGKRVNMAQKMCIHVCKCENDTF
jgi:hypothetical protein